MGSDSGECYERVSAACNMSEGVEGSGVIEEEYDEGPTRDTWAILTWIVVALTILLNLILIGVLVFKRNLHSIANKLIFSVTISDLIGNNLLHTAGSTHSTSHFTTCLPLSA